MAEKITKKKLAQIWKDWKLHPDTLQLTKSYWKTLWLTLLIFIMLILGTEVAMRLEVIQAFLTPPKMSSRHYQLGHKLTLLEEEIRENGPVDCIMVGSSMVDTGFDPDAFRKGFLDFTGDNIQCFNFGIDASTVASTHALVDILTEDYRPRLLIVGTDARDYAVPAVDNAPAVILETAWVKYRLGDFSLEGWLQEHSYFYRYRQHLSQLLRFNFENTLKSWTEYNFPILPNGFTPLRKVAAYINDPPDPQDDSYEVTYYTQIFSSFQIFEENLAALDMILDHNNSETKVIVLEMPVSDGLYYFFGNGETDYNKFLDKVSKITNLHQASFWRTETIDLIPDDGWSDYSHLNKTGAGIFSRWLGQKVGEWESTLNNDALKQ